MSTGRLSGVCGLWVHAGSARMFARAEKQIWMYVCRSSFACEWFCKLRLFAHVPSLGSNHGMRVCDIPSHATGLLICCP